MNSQEQIPGTLTKDLNKVMKTVTKNINGCLVTVTRSGYIWNGKPFTSLKELEEYQTEISRTIANNYRNKKVGSY